MLRTAITSDLELACETKPTGRARTGREGGVGSHEGAVSGEPQAQDKHRCGVTGGPVLCALQTCFAAGVLWEPATVSRQAGKRG